MEGDLQKKEAFFKVLYDSDEAETKDCEFALFLQHSKTPTVPIEPLLPLVSPQSARLERTVSAPVQSKSPFADDVSIVKDTPFPSRATVRNHDRVTPFNVPDKTITSSTRNNTAMPKGQRKRKRASSLDLLPESQQIFRGLGFCT